MFIVISPAKKLDFESQTPIDDYTDIKYAEKAMQLIKELRKCSQDEISKLMKLSDSLAKLNVDRYKSYNPKFNENEEDEEAAKAEKSAKKAGKREGKLDTNIHYKLLNGNSQAKRAKKAILRIKRTKMRMKKKADLSSKRRILLSN